MGPMMSPKRRKDELDTSTTSDERRKEVKKGEVVALDGGTQRILVRDVTPTSDGRYRGIVYAFSPSFELEHQGMKVGVIVFFDAEDVVG
jgi:hypothetical protein